MREHLAHGSKAANVHKKNRDIAQFAVQAKGIRTLPEQLRNDFGSYIPSECIGNTPLFKGGTYIVDGHRTHIKNRYSQWQPERMHHQSRTVKPFGKKNTATGCCYPQQGGIKKSAPDKNPQAYESDRKEHRRLHQVRNFALEVLVDHLMNHVGLILYAIHQRCAVDDSGHIVGQAGSIRTNQHDGASKQLGKSPESRSATEIPS